MCGPWVTQEIGSLTTISAVAISPITHQGRLGKRAVLSSVLSTRTSPMGGQPPMEAKSRAFPVSAYFLGPWT